MKDSKADFAALLAASGMDYRRGFNPGEEVRATVVSTKGHYVVIDVGAKDEGVVPKEEFILEDGTLRAKEGERLTVWFVGMRQGNLLFTARNKATGRGDAALRQAFEAGTPIDGLVKGEVKGGYEVEVAGQRAFCPYSQMDLHRAKDAAEYIGTKQTFLISEYGEDDRGSNLIVSRRALLERERNAKKGALLAELAEGQVREGTVTRVMDFGVFVDLGGAFDGKSGIDKTLEKIASLGVPVQSGGGLRTMEEIEELRQNNYVMELTYIDTDGKTSYDRVAPICFKERENDQYLLALTEDDRVAIFPVAHITCVSETETRTTFSLPENFDSERFFDVGKIM